MLLLAMVQPILGVTKDDDKEKPAQYKLYDFTKGGTDVVYLKMASSTTKPKSNRWPIVAFSHIIDETRVNANTIYTLNKKILPTKISSFDFAWDMAKSLTIPQIEQRSPYGLGEMTKIKMRLELGSVHHAEKERQQPVHSRQGEVARRCHGCLEEASGTENYEEKKEKLHCVKTICQECGWSFCSQHLTQMCKNCI